MNAYGWEAHIRSDWPAGGDRLLLRRPSGDRSQFLVEVGTDGGGAVLQDHDPATVLAFEGLWFPEGALDAVAEVLRPGPSPAEVAVLREALAVERERVDRVLREGVRP
jgi:hypothetical protein